MRIFEISPPPGLPAHYVNLVQKAPVYQTLEAIRTNSAVAWVSGAGTWFKVKQGAALNKSLYYLTESGWISGEALNFAIPSALRGIHLQAYPGERLGMVYWPEANIRSEPGVIKPDNIVRIARRYDLISIQEEKLIGEELWYRIGDHQWVYAKLARLFIPSTRPTEVGKEEKWIEVNLSEQTLIAHEGDTAVYATLTATGLPYWPTAKGLFRIYNKQEFSNMRGGFTLADAYNLDAVPWTMYFYGDYGLHAAYWHDLFGTQRSHGCVNLSPFAALWLYQWAGPAIPAGQPQTWASSENPGTWVWVHD